MSLTRIIVLVAAVVIVVGGATFLNPRLTAGGSLAVLASISFVRLRLPPTTSVTRLQPDSFMEGMWALLWIWMGVQPSIGLFLRNQLYYFSLGSVVVNVAIATLACIAYFLQRTPKLRGVPWVATVLIGALTGAVLSLLLTPVVPSGGISTVVGRLMGLTANLLAIVVLFKAVRDPQRALALAVQTFATGVAITVGALIVSGGLSASRFGNEAVLHPNTVAGLSGVAALLLMSSWKRLGKWWLIPVLVALLLALFASFSKTALLAFGIALAVWTMLDSPGRSMWRGVVTSLFAIAALLLVGGRFISYMDAYLNSPFGAATLSGRTQLWEETIRVWQTRPMLGYGYTLYPDVIAELAPTIRWDVSNIAHAHNSLLTVLLEMGIVGGSMLVGLVTGVVVGALRLLRREQSRAIVVPLLTVLTFVIVRSVTEGDLAFRGDLPYVVLAALVIEAMRGRSYKRRPPARPATALGSEVDLPPDNSSMAIQKRRM